MFLRMPANAQALAAPEAFQRALLAFQASATSTRGSVHPVLREFWTLPKRLR